MSNYLDRSTMKKGRDTQTWWTSTFEPGEAVPVAGIYKCTGCTREVVGWDGELLPPQTYHQHPVNHQNVQWRLNVRANISGEL